MLHPSFKPVFMAGFSCLSVVSLNLKRRHLDTSQRAMVAAKLANLNHGQKKSDTVISVSQPEAAKLLNVSTDSVQFAKKVIDQGTEQLIQKLDAGEIAVSTAARIKSPRHKRPRLLKDNRLTVILLRYLRPVIYPMTQPVTFASRCQYVLQKEVANRNYYLSQNIRKLSPPYTLKIACPEFRSLAYL